ncbi:MAG: hypothetical protein NC911_06110 [Candidatus Omnitrophica bacterium]|nr:hypothetical protein [Candidatus Omnitrophota bacterium]
MKSWKAAGVIVRSFSGTEFWSLEIYIPFETLGVREVQPGLVWQGNFIRARWREGEMNSRGFPPHQWARLAGGKG